MGGETEGDPDCIPVSNPDEPPEDFCQGEHYTPNGQTEKEVYKEVADDGETNACNGGSKGSRKCVEGSKSYCCYWKTPSDPDVAPYCAAILWQRGTAECE